MDKEEIKDRYYAHTTPFNQEGHIDFSKLKQHVAWMNYHGWNNIVVTGTTAEFPFLSEDEHMALIEFFGELRQEGLVDKIIVNCSGKMDEQSIQFSKKAQSIGAIGAMFVPCYGDPVESDTEKNKRVFSLFENLKKEGVAISLGIYQPPASINGSVLKYSTLEILAKKFPDHFHFIKDSSKSLPENQFLNQQPLFANGQIIYLNGDDSRINRMWDIPWIGYVSGLASGAPDILRLSIKGDSKMQNSLSEIITYVREFNPEQIGIKSMISNHISNYRTEVRKK